MFRTLFIKFSSTLIGKDENHNIYMESKKADFFNRKKRYIIYNDWLKDSSIAPIWHAWLHHEIDGIPNTDAKIVDNNRYYKLDKKQIEKSYLSNIKKRTLNRQKVSADYIAWKP